MSAPRSCVSVARRSAPAIDLRDFARRDGSARPFAKPFDAMRKRQLRRRGFFDRWKRENEPEPW
jgi:hypothetical protein